MTELFAYILKQHLMQIKVQRLKPLFLSNGRILNEQNAHEIKIRGSSPLIATVVELVRFRHIQK